MSESPIDDSLFEFIGEGSDIDLNPEDVDRATEQGKSIEEKLKEAELDRYNQDTSHRGNLSTWAAAVVSVWLVSVLLILANNTKTFMLSDTVLVAFLGTTTLNVLGLMIIVLNDLFNKAKK